MNSTNPSEKAAYQLVLAAPTFCLGVRCDEQQVAQIDFLPPAPSLAPSNALARGVATQLGAYLKDAEFVFDLPMRAAGTPFQRRVWAQIAAIPVHQTRTYGTLASALNSAPRAVGQACGANPLPILLPCHRVCAAGGGLGGFARHGGGFLLDVKRWLLAHEQH
ncbi:MAG: methylated-DNA--[protein]-cysteine S-methyltransferase [Pseudomonadota bacterium]